MPDFTQAPVLVGPVLDAIGQTTTLGNVTQTLVTNGQFSGPFKIGDFLYVLNFDRLGPPFKIRVFRRPLTDLAWVEQNPGEGPTIDFSSGSLPTTSDINSGVIYFALYTQRFPVLGIEFYSFTPGSGFATAVFDTITDLTLNAVTGLPEVGSFAFVVRPDGTAVVVYETEILGVRYNIYRSSLGGAWSAATTIIQAEAGSSPTFTLPAYGVGVIVADSSNRIHGFLGYSELNPLPGPVTRGSTAYFQISSAGVLTTAPVLIDGLDPGIAGASGRPRIFNGTILLPTARWDTGVVPITFDASLYTGDDLDNPSWTKTDFETGQDPKTGLRQAWAQLIEDGSSIYFAWIYQPDDGSALEIRRSINNGGGWGATDVLYDLLANPPNADAIATQAITAFYGAQIGSIGVVMAVFSPGVVSVAYFLSGAASPNPPVVVTSQGKPAPNPVVYVNITDHDLCLVKDYKLFECLDRSILVCDHVPDCVCKPEREWGPTDQMPPEARAFNNQGGILLPAPAAGDTVIFSFRVPYGYDGVLLARYQQASFFFQEGIGDIEWRVAANGRYLRDMGNVQVTLGSTRKLYASAGGVLLFSGNLVEYIVSAPNLSGLLPPAGQGTILAGVHGYFYPRKGMMD